MTNHEKQFCLVENNFGCHCWLARQWILGTRFTLLDEAAVAPAAQIPNQSVAA